MSLQGCRPPERPKRAFRSISLFVDGVENLTRTVHPGPFKKKDWDASA